MIKNNSLFLIVDKEPQTECSSFQSSIQCLQVYTAADCLSVVMKKNVGVVLIDENLPDISGLTLVSLLKKLTPDVEIIFTTSCHEPQKEIDARLAGILYYGVKPVDWTLLHEIIERTLSKKNKTLHPLHHS